jgi:metal-responsive CopG/Arc/MetJ family transcriptional regulator
MTDKQQKFADSQVAFHVPLFLLRRVDELAERELISRSAWLRRLVARAVREEGAVI